MAGELARCVAEGRPYRLLDLKLYLTRRCNLRCLMCTAWVQDGAGQDELDTGEILCLIDEAKALGLVHLKFFGGEPLLRCDLGVLVAHAAGWGIRSTVITNGVLLSRERAEALVEAGLSQLDLSLDAGDPILHDTIRGVPGAWQRAVEGIQAVQAASRRLGQHVVLRINTVVMRQNLHDLPNLARIVRDLGVDEIVLNPAVPQPGNPRAEADVYMLSARDIHCYNAEFVPQVVEVLDGYRLSADRHRLYLYGTTDQDIEDAARGRYAGRLHVGCCYKPWYYAVVRENGTVVGCNRVKDPLARIGNVREASLSDLWHSEAYRGFRNRCCPPQFDDCEGCCYHFALLNKEIEDSLVLSGLRRPAEASSGLAAS